MSTPQKMQPPMHREDEEEEEEEEGTKTTTDKKEKQKQEKETQKQEQKDEEFDYRKYIRGKGTPEEPFEYTTPDGTTYVFDAATQQWVKQPPLATLAAQQQSAYQSTPGAAPAPASKRKKKEKKKAPQNTSVYITGLPQDITQQELIEYFSKCGVIKKDPETAKPKVKIYTTEDGTPKGDARVTYFRPESVPLALSILDGSEIRPGYPLSVTEAVFENKGDGPKPKKKPKSKKIKLYDQSRELSWDEYDNCHVVIKNMFRPEDAKGDIFYFDELREEVEEECAKLGPVERVRVFEVLTAPTPHAHILQRNPEGVVIVKFKEAIDANRCVQKMNGRYFGGRQLEAFFYDNFTNYEVKETEEEQKERLDAFGDWLENEPDE